MRNPRHNTPCSVFPFAVLFAARVRFRALAYFRCPLSFDAAAAF